MLLRKQDVRPQEFYVVANCRRDFALNTLQREHRVCHLALLEVNPGQSVGGVIANRRFYRALEHRADRPPGTMMHPIAQLEVAQRELGVIDVEEE